MTIGSKNCAIQCHPTVCLHAANLLGCKIFMQLQWMCYCRPESMDIFSWQWVWLLLCIKNNWNHEYSICECTKQCLFHNGKYPDGALHGCSESSYIISTSY